MMHLQRNESKFDVSPIVLSLIAVPSIQATAFAQSMEFQPKVPSANLPKEHIHSFFINGIATYLDPSATKQAQAKADNIGRSVTLIYNDTLDTREMMKNIDEIVSVANEKNYTNLSYELVKVGGKFTQLAQDVANSAVCKLSPSACQSLEKSSEALYLGMRTVLQAREGIVDVHAFSQGAILTHAALLMLRNDSVFNRMSESEWNDLVQRRIRVTTYGAGQHLFNIGHVKEFGFCNDFVLLGTGVVDVGLSSYIDGVQIKTPYGQQDFNRSQAQHQVPGEVVHLSTAGAHDFLLYASREAEFHCESIYQQSLGNGVRMAEIVGNSIRNGELSDALHRQIVSGLSIYNASVATPQELAELQTFSRTLLDYEQRGQLGNFKLSDVEREILKSQVRMDPAAPRSSNPEAAPVSIIDDLIAKAPRVSLSDESWPKGWFERSGAQVPSQDSVPKDTHLADLDRHNERQQDRMKEDRQNRAEMDAHASRAQRALDTIEADKLMAVFQAPSPSEDQLDENPERFKQGGSRLTELANTNRLNSGTFSGSKEQGIGIVSVIASIFGTPATGAAVRATGAAAMNRRLSPTTIIQGIAQLFNKSEQNSTDYKKAEPVDISCLTKGIDPALPPKEYAWQTFQRIKADNPDILGSGEFSKLSKEQLTEMLVPGGNQKMTPAMEITLRQAIENSLSKSKPVEVMK